MSNPRFLTGSAADIMAAARTLADGNLLGLPTETVYGLAADALNPRAVAAIFSAKGRPADHPLIIHLASSAQVPLFAAGVPAFATALIKAFWPGPLTLILPRRAGVADAAAGGHATVALRCPSHPLAQQVLQQALALGVQGVAAPSANLFGRVSPTTALHVREAFADLHIMDGGDCDVGIESAIVDLSRGAPVLLRPGMLTAAQLSAVCGSPVQTAYAQGQAAAGVADAPAAPGTLESHYAPRARVRLMNAAAMAAGLQSASLPVAALWLRTPLHVPPGILSLRMPADAAGCAHELFARLRELDTAGVGEIWIETLPADAVWDGVRDRLLRASA
ncbi:MAG: threonylcarbamoyl-AMP synthase [Limnohabitans sp.]|nr:threonylcarbamoyl-AMP synthase [Limnohabitans sp.]